MDQALGALVSPTQSVLGKPSCPSKNTKMMDTMLTRMQGAMAVQGQLVNTGAILALYQRQLAKQFNEDVAGEAQQVSSLLVKLIREQAVATGRAMASLWMVRRHLWLSQSQLQGEDRACLLRLPVAPSALFGPDASKLLQQAQDARRCAREMSSVLRQCREQRASTSQPGAHRLASGAPADLRVQLEANRRSRGKGGQRSGQGRGQGPPRPSPQS